MCEKSHIKEMSEYDNSKIIITCFIHNNFYSDNNSVFAIYTRGI